MDFKNIEERLKGIAVIAFDPKKLNEAEIAGLKKLIDGVNVARNSLTAAKQQAEHLELTIQHAENAIDGAEAKLQAELSALEGAYPIPKQEDKQEDKAQESNIQAEALIATGETQATHDAGAYCEAGNSDGHSSADAGTHCDAGHVDCSAVVSH